MTAVVNNETHSISTRNIVYKSHNAPVDLLQGVNAVWRGHELWQWRDNNNISGVIKKHQWSTFYSSFQIACVWKSAKKMKDYPSFSSVSVYLLICLSASLPIFMQPYHIHTIMYLHKIIYLLFPLNWSITGLGLKAVINLLKKELYIQNTSIRNS